MKNPRSTTKKSTPTCLEELDFEILCRTEGKEKAIEIMLLTIAIRKESAAYSASGQPKAGPPKIPIESQQK